MLLPTDPKKRFLACYFMLTSYKNIADIFARSLGYRDVGDIPEDDLDLFISMHADHKRDLIQQWVS